MLALLADHDRGAGVLAGGQDHAGRDVGVLQQLERDEAVVRRSPRGRRGSLRSCARWPGRNRCEMSRIACGRELRRGPRASTVSTSRPPSVPVPTKSPVSLRYGVVFVVAELEERLEGEAAHVRLALSGGRNIAAARARRWGRGRDRATRDRLAGGRSWRWIQHVDRPVPAPRPASRRSGRKRSGPWLYVLLFAIVFCETGLVVTPFLPGDSLLFAVGRAGVDPRLGAVDRG